MSSPFRVKEFHAYNQPTNRSTNHISVEQQMNAWFEELAADTEHEYDIRQILNSTTLNQPAVLVFYEVADVVPDIADDPQDA